MICHNVAFAAETQRMSEETGSDFAEEMTFALCFESGLGNSGKRTRPQEQQEGKDNLISLF